MAAAPPAPTSRVLLAGDVCGRLDALYARVAAVAAKAGPFDALLCVGRFFEEETEEPGVCEEGEEEKGGGPGYVFLSPPPPLRRRPPPPPRPRCLGGRGRHAGHEA